MKAAIGKKKVKPKVSATPAMEPAAKPAEKTYDLLLKILFGAFAALIMWGVAHHESWADEGQSWLLARELGPVDIFKKLPREGHPPLFYLILMPLAHAGLPYATAKWVASAFMIGAIFLLFFKTKLPLFLKLAVPFSYYFIYLYGVFGRSYSLIPFFLMATVALYPKRFERPWLYAASVICLFNTHMHFYSFTLGLLALYIFEVVQSKRFDRQIILSTACMVAGGLYLIPFFESNQFVELNKHLVTDHWSNIEKTLTHGILLYNTTPTSGMLLCIALAGLLISRPKALFLLLCGIGGMFYIMAFRYHYVQSRHYGVLMFVLLGAYSIAWLYRREKTQPATAKQDFSLWGTWLLAGTFLMQVFPGLIAQRTETEKAYSWSEDLADFLISNNLENSIMMGHHQWAAHAVLPHMPSHVRFYDARCKMFYSYFVYDACTLDQETFTIPDLLSVAKEQFPHKLDKLVFIFNARLNTNKPQFNYLEQIYASPEDATYSLETYNVYRYRKDAIPH
jgi:hypothetical protein